MEYQLDRIVAETDHATEAGKALILRKIVEILTTVPGRAERDAYIGRVWKHHPMAAHGPSIASQQLHRDAETRITEKRRAARRNATAPAKPPEAVVNTQPLSAEERAERELLRALADSEWRAVVLQRITPDDFITEHGRRFARFVGDHSDELSTESADLASLLDRHEEEEFSLSIRQLLQEIYAGMVKVPVTEAAIEGCANTLRQHRIEQLKGELRQLLPDLGSQSSITKEDRARVQEYQQLIRKLQGMEAAV